MFSREGKCFRGTRVLLVSPGFSFRGLRRRCGRANFTMGVGGCSDVSRVRSRLFTKFFLPLGGYGGLGRRCSHCTEGRARGVDFYRCGFVPYQFISSGGRSQGGLVRCVCRQLFRGKPRLVVIRTTTNFKGADVSCRLVGGLSISSGKAIPVVARLSGGQATSVFGCILLARVSDGFSDLDSRLIACRVGRKGIPLVVSKFSRLLSGSRSSIRSSLSSSSRGATRAVLSAVTRLLRRGSYTGVILASEGDSVFTNELFRR